MLVEGHSFLEVVNSIYDLQGDVSLLSNRIDGLSSSSGSPCLLNRCSSQLTLADHSASSSGVTSVSFQDSLLATGGDDNVVIVYDTSDWSIVATLKDHTGGG